MDIKRLGVFFLGGLKIFQDVHPTPTAGSGKPYRDERYLRNTDPKDSNIWQCPHCGMFNDIREESPVNKEGEGTRYITVTHSIPGGTKDVVEARRVSGCILCKHDYTKNTYGKKLFSTVNLQGL